MVGALKEEQAAEASTLNMILPPQLVAIFTGKRCLNVKLGGKTYFQSQLYVLRGILLLWKMGIANMKICCKNCRNNKSSS